MAKDKLEIQLFVEDHSGEVHAQIKEIKGKLRRVIVVATDDLDTWQKRDANKPKHT